MVIKTNEQALEAAIDLHQQNDRLKEHKATFINSALTGKVKVPGVDEYTPAVEVA